MKEAAWDNLVSRYPDARGLEPGDIKGLYRIIYPTINLRPAYRKITIYQARTMPHISIHEEADWGFYGQRSITTMN